ncbi:hypothetical protein GCM10010254_60030 [Streptomyces chromofuscus]|uniref:Cytochrome P450 n=1 Tax=Streptomyces chromofuscus TaxID=42881 RepID=A0A7M2T8N6_STRCW|nr:hypothetical protein [Streptomyces chromofuscus]QOV44243.1 hypothetical protein IPT68_32175 [Streptomyces chromofuscus]GGT31516.1 hypothetical protein GCM10010254_60030 [Streptomyces chromofuscus]
MAEETTGLTERARPPVRPWPTPDLEGTRFDPVLTDLMREGPLTRIQLPFGEGWAWLATRYDDLRAITNDPRFGRAEVTRRPHLSFGNGPHHCTGAVLARTLTELLVDTLPARLPGLRLAVPAEQVAWRRKTMIRGPVDLPCTW